MTPSTQSPGELSGNPGELKSPGEGELIAPHCQLCGGDVEGWICQTCEADFEEVGGLLILKSDNTHASLTERVARMEEERAMLMARYLDDELAFKMIDVGQTAVPDHWRFRCDARKIAQIRLKARQDPKEGGSGETARKRSIPSVQVQKPASHGEGRA